MIQTPPPSTPSPGDLYTFPIERIGKHGALQVVATDAENRSVTVAVLNWVGEAPATIGDLAGVGRMTKDFMSWQAKVLLQHAPLPMPSRYLRIGTQPVTGETECRTYGGWHFDGEIARQHWWDGLPQGLTSDYKAAKDSERVIVTPGLVYERSGEPLQMKAGATGSFRDDGGYRLTDDFCMASLQAWPRLSQVHLQAWRDDLLAFLEASPLVGELVLGAHGQQVLDFSATHLDRLSVDVTGVRRLVLPRSLENLILRGRAVEGLHVEAHEQGRWIHLHLQQGAVMTLSGLERIETLRVNGIRQLSISLVLRHHPGVRALHLFGDPGVLHELQSLPSFAHLESVWFVDLFGYTAEDFPRPEAFPVLTSLDLQSTPAEVAAWVRRAFKKTSHIEVSVRQPRKPEWLQENLGNPLRHWDGREGMPAAAAKKASTAWRAALKAVRAAKDEAARIAAVTGFLAVVQALNARHGFLYTLERDEVIDAVNVLTEGLGDDAQRALEPLIEKALDD